MALALAHEPAAAVLIASGDGTGNTAAPADDPGFANVGILNGLSAVYLGNGWVLTAWHVGEGAVTLGGVDYAAVPGSRIRLTGGGGAPPDLGVMKVVGDPGLPAPAIASSTLPTGSDVVLIGRGKDRGTPLSWMGVDGWNWGVPFTMRWGTNRVVTTGSVWADTQSFEMPFDPLGQAASTPDESHATLGDSGGAVYWKDGGQWKLAGTLFLSLSFVNQPEKTALYGNASIAADLSAYRTEILSLTSAPACSDGLDDDLDGLTDHPADPGCDSPADVSEKSPSLACDDDLDNDGDSLIDHPADPECISPSSPSEAAAVPAAAPWSLVVMIAGIAALGARRAVRSR